MDNLAQLKSYLKERGLVGEEDLQRAEDYALSTNIPLDQALVFLKLVDFQDLGNALAELYNIPYEPLLPAPPSASALEKLPLKVAERYCLFPVSYDPRNHFLTVATPHPHEASVAETLERLLSQPTRIEYRVASAAEIQTAIEVHYKGKPYIADQEVEIPQEFNILEGSGALAKGLDLERNLREKKRVLLLEPDQRRLRAMRTLLEAEGYQVVGWAATALELKGMIEDNEVQEIIVNAQAFRPQGQWEKELGNEGLGDLPPLSYYDPTALLMGQGLSYSQMSQTLISFVAFVMKRAIKAEGRDLDLVLSRVKYCKLLAFRLGLGAVETDALVIASWLSGARFGANILRHLQTPYRLEEILAPTTNEEGHRIERIIFLLVTTYQSLKKKEPQKAKEIRWLRNRFMARFSSSHRERLLVEKFLALLKDEEFLKGLEEHEGRILVVDSHFTEDSSLALRLNNHGFQVMGAKSAKEAARLVMECRVDLVISELILPDAHGLKFLNAMRRNPKTASIPFFFLASEKDGKLAAQCLEAGAEEFLTKPADLDLLLVKVQRALSKRSKGPGRGVRGSLADMSAMDIIQSVATGDKDVEIRLESNGQGGRIYIRRGEIVHAQLDHTPPGMEGLTSQEVLYKLMRFKEGRFQVLPCTVFPKRTIFGSTMSLLMEGARLADEIASMDSR